MTLRRVKHRPCDVSSLRPHWHLNWMQRGPGCGREDVELSEGDREDLLEKEDREEQPGVGGGLCTRQCPLLQT